MIRLNSMLKLHTSDNINLLGSISDPDPYQYETDPKHCFSVFYCTYISKCT